MRISTLARVAPIVAVVGLSMLLVIDKESLHVQATLFSPTQSEQGITITANTDSVVLCVGNGTFPVTSGALTNDTSTRFWVYEYTGNEPPNNGAYYVSAAQHALKPDTAQGPALTQMTRGKMYYVKSDRDLHFQCGIGFSAIGSSVTSPTNGNFPIPQLNTPGSTTGGGNTTTPQPGSTSATCSTITCSYTLAPGCQYVPGVSQNGCPACGTVSCSGSNQHTQSQCTPVECAAPFPGCHYENAQTQNGCPTSCGTMVCPQNGSQTSQANSQQASFGGTNDSSCIPVDCAAPPTGCRYINAISDANGCQVSCGQLSCQPSADQSSSTSTAQQASSAQNQAVITTDITTEPDYSQFRSGNTVSFDVTITDQQGTTDGAYVGLFPFGQGEAADRTLTFNPAQSDSRCRAMLTGQDIHGNYDPIWAPYNIDSAAAYCFIGAMSQGQTETVHITYNVIQDISPLCQTAAGMDAGLTTLVRAGSMETHAADSSANLVPPVCSQQTHPAANAASSEMTVANCALPYDATANISTYGERAAHQQTNDSSYFVYTVNKTDSIGFGGQPYPVYLKAFDKTTCQETMLDKNPYLDCAPLHCDANTFKGLGFDEPSVSDNGKILDVTYQLDAPTHSEKIFHSIAILDKNGQKLSTIATQLELNLVALNNSGLWNSYSQKDAMISKDGNKVVFEGYGADLNTDPSGFHNSLGSTQVYVWQNGVITQITNYQGLSVNDWINDPWDWDARFEDDAGRFISVYLGYDPDTGKLFQDYTTNQSQPRYYKLYLYDSQTKTFYKISDDRNPTSHSQYQNAINAKIVSLGGTVSLPASQGNPEPDQTQQPQYFGTDNGQVQQGSNVRNAPSQQCTTDADCGVTFCDQCNANNASCLPICRTPFCNAGVCGVRFSF